MYALPLMQGNGLSTSAAYYSGPGGTGSKYMVGDLIHSSGVLYAFDQDGMGTDEECFFIQIIDHLPDLSQIGSDTACTYYMLPYFITPSISGFAGYYTQPNAQGVRYQQGDTIFSSITLYAYDGYQSCSVEKEITVEIHDLPVFDQIPLQYGCHEYIFTPFSGENVFSDSIHFLLGNQTFYLEDITTTSGKVEVVAQNGTCFTADTFQLSIINKISIDPPGDTLICGFRFLLPAITGINLTENAKYYTELSGLGQAFLADETYNINNSSILYVFDQITGTDCIDEQIFSLNYINAPNAYKSFTTTVCKGYPYNIYELLLARNIERKSNKIYSINDQVALEPGSIFNTADYPPGEYLFYVIDSASYPCINDTAIMTVVVTINCTNADKNEIYCLNNHDYPLLLAT